MSEIDCKKFITDLNVEGFTVHKGIFDKNDIAELNEYAATLGPERGHDKNQKWYGWNTVAKMSAEDIAQVDWAYYWTPHAYHPIIGKIKSSLEPCIDQVFGNDEWEWYVQDFIVLHPGMNFVRPHVDTPYRFKEFKYDERLLGLQFMVMMCDFNEKNGATGYVPGTHKYFHEPLPMTKEVSWEIFFRDNCKQYTAEAGSFVCWHPRLMHSTMPNKTDQVRRALLLHASHKDAAKRLPSLDPATNHSLRTS